MRRLISTAALALVACASEPPPSSGSLSRALEAPISYTLNHSNVLELDGKADVIASVEAVGGNTAVTLTADPSWPVTNPFLGFDKFFYNADFTRYPIIHIEEAGCDANVDNSGHACGWSVNKGTCTADGFGCFASLASADPGGHAGVTLPVTFTIAGLPMLAPNEHGARFSTHVRFGEGATGAGCSGFLSDGVNSSPPTSDPGCTAAPEPSCVLVVSPARLVIPRGGNAAATVTATELNGDAPITLSLTPMPPPAGYALSLAPNPVDPPGDSTLGIAIGSTAELGTTVVHVHGAATAGSPAFACDTTISVEVVDNPPPTTCGCQ